MRRIKISILSHDLSGNALSRAYMLAKLLQDEYDVHIVGCGQGAVWEPVRNDAAIEYRPYHARNIANFWLGGRRVIRRLIDGDLILAVKPLLGSFGLGLRARRLLGRPLLLDIDDWEMGFISDSVYWEARILKWSWLASATSPLYTRLLDRQVHRADAITVSSRFLQRRYGGHWIGQARDERLFDRDRLGTPASGEPVVLFLGSVREHKGVQDLLGAWKNVRGAATLRIVGTPIDSPLIKALQPEADSRVRFEGLVPFDQVPAIIASASVFVLPQKPGRAAIGQVPMKLIDAMALGCPIVATAVGDIPDWLADGAGLVVPPENPAALSQAINHLLASPEEASRLGARARARFIRYGSFTSVRERLLPLVASLIARRPLPAPVPPFAGGGPPGFSLPLGSSSTVPVPAACLSVPDLP
jgi:glycosyltransferase involved in cell wall biosynthesis